MKKKNEQKIEIVAAVFMALMVTSAFAGLAIGVVSATTWYVEEGESIQAVVDVASDGDTIIVRDGTYTENVDVNKRLTIQSENGTASCIVNALDLYDRIFDVSADYVNISGFTVEGATEECGIYLTNDVDYCSIFNNNLMNNSVGIYLYSSNNNSKITNNIASNNDDGIRIYSSSNNNRITNNIVNSNNNYGIRVYSSSDNNISGNTANSNNKDGIYLGFSSNNNIVSNTVNYNDYHGIDLDSSDNNIISSNTVNFNNYHGIDLDSSDNSAISNNICNSNNYGIYLDSSRNNAIVNNTANSNNYRGIHLEYSSSNNITNNTASSNTQYGIKLRSSSNNNLIYNTFNSNNWDGIRLYSSSNNNIVSNTALNNDNGIHLSYLSSNNNLIYNNYFDNINNAYDDGNNIWNIAKTAGTNIIGGSYLGGNYWSDYAGKDRDGDGFGDTLLPYDSSGNIKNGGDYLPLVMPTLNQPPTASFTYTPLTPLVNQTVTFNASSSYDSDGNITNYTWDFGDWNTTNTTEPITTYSYASAETYNVNLTVTDDDGATNSTSKLITVSELEENIFDTGSPANPYPSIFGTHNGTIKPNHTVIATKLYTYPCAGTGGHTEYARIGNKTWNATATWEGYAGDWHNISFNKTVVLLAGESYNYTIHTGSYPQIIHESPFNATGGEITCTKFTDANGKVYYDRIPAIRLWA